MPTIKSIPRIKRKTLLPGRDMTWKAFATELGKEFKHDAIDDVAATLTFFGVLSIFPFLLFTVAVLSHVVSWATIQSLVDQVSRVAPHDVTVIISQRLTDLKSHPSAGLLTVGFLGTLVSASSGVVSLMAALNRAYDVVETRSFLRLRGIALLTTLLGGVMSLVAAMVALALPAVAHFVGGPLGVAITWLRLPFAGALVMIIWALVYTYLPNVRPKFQVVTPGSIVGVLIWVLASWGFSFYASHFGNYEATYGTLGGVIVMLMWMWVSSMAVLLGAEINKVLMPAEEKDKIATHVTNMPEEAQRQEGDPALAKKGLVTVRPAPHRASAGTGTGLLAGVSLAIGYLLGRRRAR